MALGGPGLIVLRGEQVGTLFSLGAEATIGRAADNQVPMPMGSLSRRHARVFREGEDWMVVDLASSNGTRVNGRSISGPAVLQDGDRIGLGDDCELLFKAGDHRLADLLAEGSGLDQPAPEFQAQIVVVVAALIALFAAGLLVYLVAAVG